MDDARPGWSTPRRRPAASERTRNVRTYPRQSTAGRTLVLRTGALPVPMQREISWWVATCQADGERVINTCDWNRWVATAAEVVGERPRVCSFADLSLAEWTAAWARQFHADNGRLASASTRYRAHCAIRGLLRRLAIRYSDAPWWTHDVWCLRFDPRIPRRQHEPRGESTVRWDDIQPQWLRDGYTFYLYLQLESGQLTWSSVASRHVFTSRFSEFAISRGIDHPALTGDPSQLRPLVLEFRAFLRQWRRGTTGRKERGGPLDDPLRRDHAAGDRELLPGDARLPGRRRQSHRR